jgi:hypothetical protein
MQFKALEAKSQGRENPKLFNRATANDAKSANLLIYKSSLVTIKKLFMFSI